jgi:hypothetical protein
MNGLKLIKYSIICGIYLSLVKALEKGDRALEKGDRYIFGSRFASLIVPVPFFSVPFFFLYHHWSVTPF